MSNYVLKKMLAAFIAIVLAFSALTTGIVITSAAPMFGDVDNSGAINSTDALMLLQISVGIKEKTDEIVYCGDLFGGCLVDESNDYRCDHADGKAGDDLVNSRKL